MDEEIRAWVRAVQEQYPLTPAERDAISQSALMRFFDGCDEDQQEAWLDWAEFSCGNLGNAKQKLRLAAQMFCITRNPLVAHEMRAVICAFGGSDIADRITWPEVGHG